MNINNLELCRSLLNDLADIDKAISTLETSNGFSSRLELHGGQGMCAYTQCICNTDIFDFPKIKEFMLNQLKEKRSEIEKQLTEL